MKRRIRRRLSQRLLKFCIAPRHAGSGLGEVQRQGEVGPPDLTDIFKKLWSRFKNTFWDSREFREKPFGHKRFPFSFNMAFLVLLLPYILSGIYIVQTAERAVVTRFGRYIQTVGPGPHWILPFIEAKEIVNVAQVATSNHHDLVLTKDGNLVSIGIAVQYRIGSDEQAVRSYLFNVVNPTRSLNRSAESALRQVLGQFTMDEVLTEKRSEISIAIKAQIIETLKNYNTGIQVLEVAMQFADPPEEVRAAFDDVIKASADEERLVNQAKAYENEVLPKAKSTAERLKNEAIAYKEAVVLGAEGNAQRFNLIFPQYLKAPQVTQSRLYLEALEKVLAQSSKIVVDTGQGGNQMLYLPLEKWFAESLPVSEKKP